MSDFFTCIIARRPETGTSEMASFVIAWFLGGVLPMAFAVYSFNSIFCFVLR